MSNRKLRIDELKIDMEKRRLLKIAGLTNVEICDFVDTEFAKTIFNDISNNLENYSIESCVHINKEDLCLEYIEGNIRIFLEDLISNQEVTYLFIGLSSLAGIKTTLEDFLSCLGKYVKLLEVNGYINQLMLLSSENFPVVVLDITEYETRLINFKQPKAN